MQWWRNAVLRRIKSLWQRQRDLEAYRDEWYPCPDTLGYRRATLGMAILDLRMALCNAVLPEERKARKEEWDGYGRDC